MPAATIARGLPGPLAGEWPAARVRRKGENGKDMRALLTMCTLVGALLGPPGAHASNGVADRSAESDIGFLDVGSSPRRVSIDDADTKTITPQSHLALKAGHHKLTLVTLDGARKRSLASTSRQARPRP